MNNLSKVSSVFNHYLLIVIRRYTRVLDVIVSTLFHLKSVPPDILTIRETGKKIFTYIL